MYEYLFYGNSNVIKFNGLRIGGLSGVADKLFDHIVFKNKAEIAKTGYYEHLPFDARDKKSVCHTRYLDIYRMSQLSCSNLGKKNKITI